MKEQEMKPFFSENFSNLRKNMGMSQAEFASFLGISRPSVGFYENGQRFPDANVLKRIAMKCDISSDYLLGITDVKSTNPGIRWVGEKYRLSEDSLEKLSELNKINVKEVGDRIEFEHIISQTTENVKSASPAIQFINLLIENLDPMDISYYFMKYAKAKEQKTGMGFLECFSKDDEMRLYAMLIAEQVKTILIEDEDPNTFSTRLERVVKERMEVVQNGKKKGKL